MKRLKLMAIGTLVAVSLVACGQKQETKMQSDNAKTEQTTTMEDKKMDDKMSEDKKMEDEMKDDKTKESEMKDDKMSQDKKMEEDKMSDDKKTDTSMKKEDDMKKSDNMKKEDNMKTQAKTKDNKQTSTDKKMSEDKKMSDENTKAEQVKVEKMNDGDIAPDINVVDKDGNTFTLSSQIGKRKTYVKFWASWCSICLAGMEDLNKLAGEDTDFDVVTIVSPGIGGEMKKDDFIKWFDGLGYSNTKVYFDESGDAMRTYGVRAFPTSAVVGSDGVLIGVQPGHIDSQVIKKVFEEVK